MSRAAYLVILSKGLIVSGITTWTLRVCAALAASGRTVGIAIHRAPPDHDTLHTPMPRAVRAFDFTHLPDLERCAGDLAPFIPAYAHAARELARAGAPVVITPYYLGDCFAAAAALTMIDPVGVRLLAVQQLMIPYESHVLSHYEPAISGYVGVSDAISAQLRAALPHRAGDVRTIPNSAPVPAQPPRPRPPLAGRPLALIYTGRMEHEQKRIGALIEMSRALTARNIDHRLTLVGDGPAQADVDARLQDPALLGRARRRAPVAPDLVERLLDDHDLFVLASRAEGLSLSLVEAMARACVPVITRTPSGAAQVVEPGVSGELVEAPHDATESEVGHAMADGVQRAIAAGLDRLAKGAWETARAKFSIERCAEDVGRAIDEAAASPAHAWPATRPLAFTSAAAASGSGAVPPDGAARLRDRLARLADRRIILHGTGRHTTELAHILAESPSRIVALADDDPARQGRTMWNWPVIAPAEAARTGATDVVISSWMNQDAIWDRRAVYERQGLTVHRLYDGPKS